MYPCRAQKHTPRNVLRRRFAPKIGRVLGVSLLRKVKSGGFLGVSVCGNMELDKFFTYPCRAYCIRPYTILAQGLGLKSGGFWVYPDTEI